tara:strand:+ start:457 stop:699 length:243 start_codon:yes stop_codon:yes gene_type:complete
MFLKSKILIRHFSKFKRPPPVYAKSKFNIKKPSPEYQLIDNKPSFYVSPNFDNKLNEKEENCGKNIIEDNNIPCKKNKKD